MRRGHRGRRLARDRPDPRRRAWGFPRCAVCLATFELAKPRSFLFFFLQGSDAGPGVCAATASTFPAKAEKHHFPSHTLSSISGWLHFTYYPYPLPAARISSFRSISSGALVCWPLYPGRAALLSSSPPWSCPGPRALVFFERWALIGGRWLVVWCPGVGNLMFL